MRRKPSAAADRSETPTELIARISAEHRSPAVAAGRHHRSPAVATGRSGADDAGGAAAHAGLVVTVDPVPQRSIGRRLAPLAVGAAALLVAVTVASLVRPPEDATQAAPELDAVVQAEATTMPRPAPAAPTATPAPGPSATAGPTPEAAAGDAGQAAGTRDWTLVGRDEFDGGRSPMWADYDGPGHAGHGRRTSEAISVENGALVIRGDAEGNTGGVAWKEGRRFGRWEIRARFPEGDRQYRPTLLLWPTDRDWPAGGEIDFAETTSASDDVSFFLHHGPVNRQRFTTKALDITRWHTYAVEWVDGRVTGYVDGERWFETADAAMLPPGAMHPTIQLDYFPDGGSPRPSEMHVDYLRIYE
jgi:hypothetical protein